jgi:hypothetical protein
LVNVVEQLFDWTERSSTLPRCEQVKSVVNGLQPFRAHGLLDSVRGIVRELQFEVLIQRVADYVFEHG